MDGWPGRPPGIVIITIGIMIIIIVIIINWLAAPPACSGSNGNGDCCEACID